MVREVFAKKLREARIAKGWTQQELAEHGIYPNTIRLSVGTEHIDDILADLQRGFEAVKEG